MPLINGNDVSKVGSEPSATSILCVMRAAEALASLHICADSSEPSLLTGAVSIKISCICSFIILLDAEKVWYTVCEENRRHN